MTKNKWMIYILKIRNKQINKVNYKKEKRNINIKYNIVIRHELKEYYIENIKDKKWKNKKLINVLKRKKNGFTNQNLNYWK